MRTVLLGAVESTLVTLKAMVDVGHPPVAVMTLPPDLRHRHSDYEDLRPLAAIFDIPVIEIRNCNDAPALAAIRSLLPDIVWVVGWSQLCGPGFLSIPKHGTIGYHPARLPENRGRAVIPWTILQGSSVTGSTLFWIGEGMDDGDIVVQENFDVAHDETAASLIQKHMTALDGMVRTIAPIEDASSIPALRQDHTRASYCARRTKEDGLIDWHWPANEVWRFIRAVGRPYPGAFTYFAGLPLTIWSAEYVGKRPIWALPGQIVESGPEGHVIQCGDREHVLVTEWAFPPDEQHPPLSPGTRLRGTQARILT